LVTILRKTVIDSKWDWDTKLTAALWAYRTTYKVTTKATPFSLMYGIEAILPIEFEVQTLRIATEQRLDTLQSLKDRLASLEALNEGRQLATQHVEATQRRRKVAFDKRQKKRTLLPGMWVMVQDARKLEFPAKFDALWTGPYVIKEVFSNNSIQLKTLDGVDFPTRTNGSRCKEYKV
jgi:glutamine synthetase adenylyltransferase